MPALREVLFHLNVIWFSLYCVLVQLNVRSKISVSMHKDLYSCQERSLLREVACPVPGFQYPH